MRRPWTFSRRVGAGLVASGAVALAILITSLLASRAVQPANEWDALTLSTELLEVERLRRAFNDKVSSGRAFTLTRAPLLQEQLEADRQRFLAAQARLRLRLREAPEVLLLEEAARAEQLHEDAMRQLRALPGLPASRQEVDELLRTRVGPAQARVEDALEALARHAGEGMVRTIHREVEEDRHALGFIFTAAGLGLLGMACLAWVLGSKLRPLHREAQATEQRFRLLVEGVRDHALYLLDARGRVESWNPGAERIKGWKEQEVLGRPHTIFYTQEDVAAGVPDKELARAERDGRLRTEGWRVRKDGTRFWAEGIYTTLRDESGGLRGFAKVSRDITERKRAERTHRLFAEAGRIFNQMLDPDLMVAELARLMVPELADGCLLFLRGPDGRLRPRAVSHVSAEKERLLWELLQHASREKGGLLGAEQVVETGRSERMEEVTGEALARTGVDPEQLRRLHLLELRSALSVPLGVAAQTCGALVLLSSQPERRYTATDQIFVEELAGRAALALDNVRLFQEAQRALELIGVASHDLGNPLHALKLLLVRLRRVDPESEPARVNEGLAAALRHSERLGQLLHNLLDLSRLSSGKLELEVSRFDLGELVHEVVERHAEQASEAGCRVTVELEPGLEGWWDRLRLERVVTNLLSNALKFGRSHPVELRLGQLDGLVRLTVRDHGAGVPLEAQRRIFERFEKGGHSSGKHAGFGLGLYIVRQLVEAHGGTIRVESTPGEGAAFIVELPRVPPAGVELAPGSAPGPH